ncbi:MAG: hypothetical protein IPL61_20675 [Myxococcales bacterium]|nr:hypothetical protein [Myxococcales bacterium]
MPPRDDDDRGTTPGWSAPPPPPPPLAPDALGPLDALDAPDALDAAAGPAAPAAPVSPHDPGRGARATLWRRAGKRVPTPRPRGRPVALLALEPRAALGIADFHELRREGLFADDGRNPPTSWWAR